MLFLNTQPVDRNCNAKYGSSSEFSRDDNYGSCRHLLKITVVLALIYVIVSVPLSVLHAPISLSALVVPLVVLACALVGAQTRAIGSLWLSSIAATLGTFGKILGIITYSMVFGYSGIEDEYDLSPGTSKHRHVGTRHTDTDYTRYFVALCLFEVILVGFCVCTIRIYRKCLR